MTIAKNKRSLRRGKGANLALPKNAVIVVCVLGVLVCLLLMLLDIYKKPETPKYTGVPDKISTGLTGEYGSLVLLAQQQGYFKQNGLAVTIKQYSSGAPLMSDMLAGKLDSGIASEFAGVRNTFQHEDIRILASLVKSEVFYLVARKDHGVSAIQDLRGKRIGVTRGAAGEFYLGQFLTLNGLQQSDITVVNEMPAQLADDVSSGSLDGAVIFEPYAYQTSNKLGQNGVRWSVQNLQSVSGLLYVSGAYTRSHPAALKRYMQSIAEAETYLTLHNDDAKTYIAGYLHYDQKYIDYIWPKLTLDATLDQDLLVNMEDEAGWAIENKLTTATVVPNYVDLVDFDPMLSAMPENVSMIR